MSETSPNIELPTNEDGFRYAWDSVSLSCLKACPRKYQLSIVEGWKAKPKSLIAPSTTNLDFGILLHKATETIEVEEGSGKSREEATQIALKGALEGSRDLITYKNKSRDSLIAAIVDYSDRWRGDPTKTIRLSDGTVAAELSFRMSVSLSIKWEPSLPDSILFCGHMDRMVDWQGFPYVMDTKTTAMGIGGKSAIGYFMGFNPNSQFSGYCAGAQEIYGVPVRGVIVDAVQIAKTFTRCARGVSHRTPAQIDEWKDSLGFWVGQAERFRRENYYPMNENSCHNFGGCQFRSICSRDPHVRERFLEANFERKPWNPLAPRNTSSGTIETESETSV